MQIIDNAEAPDGVTLVDFEDFDTRRKNMFDKAKAAFTAQFPRVHNGVRVEVKDVDYADPEDYDIPTQKQFIHQDKFLSRRLRGTMILKDAHTGEVLDEKKTTFMRVPYLTQRGTVAYNGSELSTIHQQRLIPGAYSRFQNNGELETQFNVRPGTGSAFKVQFNPESMQYRFGMKGSNLPLYSLLRAIGVSDDELKARWGEEVFAANAEKYDTTVLDKAYNKIVPAWEKKKYPNPTQEEKAARIKDALNKAQISDTVARKTLPSLYSREKAAKWKEGGEILVKAAGAARKIDLLTIAEYLNKKCDAKIVIEDGMKAEDLLAQIIAFVTTGMVDGDVRLGNYDASDNAAGAARMRRVMEGMAAARGANWTETL